MFHAYWTPMQFVATQSASSSSPSSRHAALFGRFGIERNRRSRGRIDLELRCLVRLAREVGNAWRCPRGIGWRRRVAAWRRGFQPQAAALYGLDGAWSRADVGLYVRDFSHGYRGYQLNGFWNPILSNKLALSWLLKALDLPHPEVLAVVSSGRLVPCGGCATEPESVLAAWTADGRRVVFRPHWSGGGEGVFFLGRDADRWLLNGRVAMAEDVAQLIKGLERYIVTAFVEQAAYANLIHPHTTNTLRVLTLCDENGPFVASVVHRFGTSRTFPVDNFHGGAGLCGAVDLQRQALGPAASLDDQHRRVLHNAHPETGQPITGVAIPGLDRALAGVLTAARGLPEASCVGWDVLITDDGYSLLEANAPPSIIVNQVHDPLLTHERAAWVFRRHGIGGRRPG